MRHARHIGAIVAVGVAVTAMVGGTVVVAHERADDARTAVAQPAAATSSALRLTATPRTLDAGSAVTFRIRTSTKHARPVRLQRWDGGRKAWRQVAKRTVRSQTTIRLRPTAGTTRYRAVAPRVRHRAGGKVHTHKAARSAVVPVTARARSIGHRPAVLTGDEKALLAGVAAARRTYGRPAVVAASDDGADACLTAYARAHSAWMAQQGRALDPGSREHRAAGRPTPGTACPGNTVWSLTRAVGAGALDTTVASTIDAWLSSPYGETTRLLTACHDAPVFEFGVSASTVKGTRWLTVLIASDTPVTRSAGVC